MKAALISFVEKALIIALIAVLTFASQSSGILAPPYGPIIGAVATVVLSVVNKLAGSPVAVVAAKLSPRPF